MNLMTVDGYHAKIEFDEELDLFRGEILGLNGGADFSLRFVQKKASNPENIFRENSISEFHQSYMNNSLLPRKQKARVSICWPKRPYASVSLLERHLLPNLSLQQTAYGSR